MNKRKKKVAHEFLKAKFPMLDIENWKKLDKSLKEQAERSFHKYVKERERRSF